MTNDEFNKLLMKMDGDARTKFLTEAGGLRGLFDPHCHEFKQSTFEEKRAMLGEMIDAGELLTIADLMEPFGEVMKGAGYPFQEAAMCFTDAVCLLLTNSIRTEVTS